MGTRLFVGNLGFDVTGEELKELFTKAGACVSAAVVTDRLTGRSRGFAFVEMGSEEDARRAVADVNGAELRGRSISVSEARERTAGGARPTGGAGFTRSFGNDAPPAGRGFRKNGKSRRGLRGRKRSI